MPFISFLSLTFSLYLALFSDVTSGTHSQNQLNDLGIVIIIQPSSYHQRLARNLMEDVTHQIETFNLNISIEFHPINESNSPGSWTYFPILNQINNEFKWILFAEPRTRINLPDLLKFMNLRDPDRKIWFGHALYDREASIIHHFAFAENPEQFKYPNSASGFLMSHTLCKHVVKVIEEGSVTLPEFSIDAGYELALFIWKSDDQLRLIHEATFCTIQADGCSTYVLPFQKCDNHYSDSSTTLFAVKTCSSYHETRVPIIKKTWGKYAKRIMYFSDTLAEDIPTVKLNQSNVDKGHCKKTKEIITYLSQKLTDYPEIKIIALVDDDTIISISHLQEFLTCFDPKDSVVIGQRYGYGMTQNRDGFNYITGGGGIVFTKEILNWLAEPGICDCPSETTPDDMFIFGVCLGQWGIVHSSGFHQARFSDYAPEYLQNDHVISFHKHWMSDPVKVYNDWFEEDDSDLYRQENLGRDEL